MGKKFVDVKPENSGIKFIRASQLHKDGVTGELLQGTFVDSVPNTLDERKSDYKFELEDGSMVVVNGAGNLGFSMKFVDVGDFVQINYQGMQEIMKGPQKGRMAHNFTVCKEEE